MALELYPHWEAERAAARGAPFAADRPVARPLVSVIVPLYNKRASVGRAVQSVLGQTWEDLELIVVDDGSDDGSSDILRFVRDDRLRVVRQDNQGVSVARNRGILEARGEFVAFLDADDEWDEDFLAVLLDVLDRHPEARVAGASYRVQGEEGQEQPLDRLFAEGQGDIVVDFFGAASVASPLHSSSILARRDLFASTGLFPPGIHHGEDMDLWLRVGMACQDKGIALTRRTASIWHTDAENRAGHRRVRPHRLPSVDRVLADPREFPQSVREFVCFMLLQQAQRLRTSGFRWRSLGWIWRARRTRRHRVAAVKELLKTFLDWRTLPLEEGA